MDLVADLPTVSAALAASLVVSDGKIRQEEKDLAVKMGEEMIPEFSSFVFETILEDIEELPTARRIAAQMKGRLRLEDKQTIINFLYALAKADDEVVAVEANELKAVAAGLGIEAPST